MCRPVGRPPVPPEVRVLAKIGNFGGEGCWPWLGTVHKSGYGTFFVSTELGEVRAHRYVYVWLTGANIDDLKLHHRPTCPKTCVNPAHLTPMTQADHIREEDSPAGMRLRQTHCKRGHEFTPENTISSRGGRACKACAVAYAKEYEQRHPRRLR